MFILEFFLGILLGTVLGVSARRRTGLHPLILIGLFAIVYILAEATVDILFTTTFPL